MNRSNRVFRASFYLSLALPFAALACGDSFTAGPGDGGDDGGIILGDAGGQDSTTDGAGSDARHDGPAEGGTKHDGSMGDGSACPPGSITCADGGCALEGPTNCGSCGNDCTMLPHVMDPQCTSGQCSFTCATGWQNCTSNPNAGCATNITMQGNCGACNVTCSGNTSLCGGTGCVSSCSSGQTLCDSGTCVDTTTNPQDCNGCGIVCPNGPPHSQPTCTNSACGSSCDMGYTQCGGACIPVAPDTTAGVFVSPGGMTTSCGSETQPCGTIAAGLAQIASSSGTKTILYLGNGTYPEQVTLPAGVTIQGGWLDTGGTWSHLCNPSPPGAIISAPSGTSTAVQASYSGSSELDTVQVQNGQTAGPGESLYGISVLGSSTALVLNDVVLSVASAGPGVDGMPATPGVAGGNGNGSACTTAQDGGSGGNGSAGAGAPPGGYSMSGYAPKSGQAGQSGGNSNNGPDGGAGACNPETMAYCCNMNDGCNQGSAGGCTNTTFCGSPGAPGCGGTPATAGTFGTGGGSSIGVFVWGGTVTITGGQYTTGNGGKGGDGGSGADGGAGALGAYGANAQWPSSCNSIYHSGTQTYTCTFGFSTVGQTGGPGSLGGNGGSAGQSGGGSGGDSYCWYANNGGSITPTGGAACSPGLAGLGGSQGAGTSQGANGNSAAHN